MHLSQELLSDLQGEFVKNVINCALPTAFSIYGNTCRVSIYGNPSLL